MIPRFTNRPAPKRIDEARLAQLTAELKARGMIL